MSTRFPGKNPTAYLGLKETNPPQLHFRDRIPTASDSRSYDQGDMWIDQTNDQVYILIRKIATNATWVDCAGGLTDITPDVGGTVSPDVSDNINLLGGTGITTTGTTGTNTVTIDAVVAVLMQVTAEDATTAAPAANNLNIVGTATNGINTTAAGSTLTISMASPYADGDFTFQNTAVTTSRTLLVNNTDAGAGSTSEVHIQTPTAGDDPFLHLEINGTQDYSFGIDNSVAGDPLKLTDGANPSVGTEYMLLDIPASRWEFPINIFLQEIANIGGGVQNIVSNTDNTNATSDAFYNAISGGASGGDAYLNLEVDSIQEYSIGIDNSDVDNFKITDGASPSVGTTFFQLTAAGVPTFPTAPLDVPSGGTGVNAITDGALIVGSGVAAITEIGPLTNGELVVGSTGADPVAAALTAPAAGITITGGAGTITFALADDLAAVEGLAATGVVSRTAADTWATSTITQNAILYGSAAEGLTNLGPLVDGDLVIGSTGAAPVAAQLTGGAGIAIASGAGTITISATGSGLAWVNATGATQAMAVATSYGANRGGGVAFSLPGTAAEGTVMEIVGILGLWSLTQAAGQSVQVGAFGTTVGAGGSLTATNLGDCIVLRCIVANTTWRVQNMMGNPAIV